MQLYSIINKLINTPNNIFYFRSFKKSFNDDFDKKGYYLDKNDTKNIKLAEKILSFCTSKLDLSQMSKDLIYNNPKNYKIDIFNKLSNELQKDILHCFSQEDLVKKISSMLKTKVVFRNVNLLYNFYNSNNTPNEGPKMWHRDSDSLSDQIKIFIPITKLSEDCGMFYFISNEYISENVKFKIDIKKKKDKSLSVWNKFRVDDQRVVDYLKDENKISKLAGKPGDTLYIDTSKVYHKGGYIGAENKFRLMLQAVYTPVLSLSDWNKNSNNFLKFLQVKFTNLKIKLQKEI